jgi:hypothetical protein
MGAENLEQLLKDHDLVAEQMSGATSVLDSTKGIQTAEKSACIYDLVKMVDKIVAVTMKDVKFAPDMDRNNVTNADVTLDSPVITYKVVSRVPKKEIKPRVRQVVPEKTFNEKDARVGEVYGQKFECILQFNIFGSVYDIAEQVMERFEEVIFTYTGYFKKNGVAELYFKEQLTDENYDIFRQQVAVRNIRYYVEIERLIPIFQDKIQEIETIGL